MLIPLHKPSHEQDESFAARTLIGDVTSNSDFSDVSGTAKSVEHPRVLKGQKVVINLFSGDMIKGYLAKDEGADLETPFRDSCGDGLRTITVKLRETDATVEVALRDLKAVFFVKSFFGTPKKKDLRFYKNGPAVGEIWAEIRFKDNEILEGLIENSVEHLAGEGFMVRPSDVESNNLAAYVNKAAIAEYRVLGVRVYRKAAS